LKVVQKTEANCPARGANKWQLTKRNSLEGLPRRPPVLNHFIHQRQKNKQNGAPHYHVKVKICPRSKIDYGLPKNIPSKAIAKEWFREINENTRFSNQLDIAIPGNFYFSQEKQNQQNYG
jgi:hypothetical protein